MSNIEKLIPTLIFCCCATSSLEKKLEYPFPEIAKKYSQEWTEGTSSLMNDSYTSLACSQSSEGIDKARMESESKARTMLNNYIQENKVEGKYNFYVIARNDFFGKNGLSTCTRMYAKRN